MDESIIPDLSPEERKAAKKAYMAVWRANNGARIRATDTAWRTKNRERLRAAARKRARKNTEKNRDRVNAANRKSYHKDIEKSREKNRLKRRKRYAIQPDILLASSLKWKHANVEHVLDYAKEWAHKNPEKGRLNQQKRKARQRHAPINDFTVQQWRALCKAAGYRCAYCQKVFSFKQLTMDHITPLSKGGSHTLSNIIPACFSCNSRKKDRAVLAPVQPFLLLPVEDAAAD